MIVDGRARRVVALAAVACVTSCMEGATVSDAIRSELAPGAVMRAGINLGNRILVASDGASADLRGIAPDVARELADRLGVTVRFVPYPSAAAVADDAASGTWDVAFIGSDPERAGTVAFTAPYVALQATYLVPVGSSIGSIADVDTPGVRVAARPRAAYDLVLRRELKNATLVYPENTETDLDLVRNGKADAVAGLRQVLEDTVATLPGARVLDGEFAAIRQAIGVPKERAAAAAYLEDFVAEMKRSGWLARTIEERGARGVSVVPE
jgi:polar amino acid transport system substrate-binding protein